MCVFVASIGLLPKRPVTLDSSPQPSSAGPADDDGKLSRVCMRPSLHNFLAELEYVTNPFEEERK